MLRGNALPMAATRRAAPRGDETLVPATLRIVAPAETAEVGYPPISHEPALRNRRVNATAAIYAGVVAGILATLAQVLLWALFTDAFPAIVFRDARFAAAIVMGRDVLPPPATFDGAVMLVATLLHFALSIVYALVLSRLVARLRTPAALLAGAGFGLCLYAVNMHGFTRVFPWFERTRDWITIAAHLAFGMSAAGAYRALTYRSLKP